MVREIGASLVPARCEPKVRELECLSAMQNYLIDHREQCSLDSEMQAEGTKPPRVPQLECWSYASKFVGLPVSNIKPSKSLVLGKRLSYLTFMISLLQIYYSNIFTQKYPF